VPPSSFLNLFGLNEPVCPGHKGAFEKCGYIHRDVSSGNVIIVRREDEEAQGLLIDWEHAKTFDMIKRGPSQPNRTVRVPHASYAVSL
jgi:hypothetical protein